MLAQDKFAPANAVLGSRFRFADNPTGASPFGVKFISAETIAAKVNMAQSARRLVLISALVLSVGCLRLEAQTMFVSLPGLHTAKDERVVGFDIRVRSGRIAQLPNVPIG